MGMLLAKEILPLRPEMLSAKRISLVGVTGKRIATSDDYFVQIYTTDIDELVRIAQSRVTRRLTAEEKDKYGVLDWESTTYTYRYPRNR